MYIFDCLRITETLTFQKCDVIDTDDTL